MKSLLKNTLLAMTLSTTLVLADDKSTTAMMLDINKVLPQTVRAELPALAQEKETAWTLYSPQQKATIVDLKLSVEAALNELPVAMESGTMTYSPLQKASIAGLKLTAEEVQEVAQVRVVEEASPAYSPQQKAHIAGLVLTAE